MAIFWISFRIAKKVSGGKTYQQRYEGLENTISEISTLEWKETTSFIVFESGSSLTAIAGRLKREISPKDDLFIIRKMDAKDAIVCGDVEDDDIYHLMMKDDGTTYLRTL